MNAQLPANLETATIAGMRDGDTAYTLPWAMWADSSRRLWLNPTYPAGKKPVGTAQMRIRRKGRGFIVYGVPGRTYEVGGGWSDGLPVTQFHPAREA